MWTDVEGFLSDGLGLGAAKYKAAGYNDGRTCSVDADGNPFTLLIAPRNQVAGARRLSRHLAPVVGKGP